ncbi:MAG: hypothetical protein FWC92_11665 [Defluviitaleaceae bacterium]|nr:hypothetical protein [Defluviitaleaceae bacterium]
MNFLSRVAKINIPIKKFTEYALNEQADKDKTIAFERALGYNLNNVDKLIENIRSNISKFPAKYKGNKGYGDLYEVVMILEGENGKSAKVLTAWMDDVKLGEVRLLTVHIDN